MAATLFDARRVDPDHTRLLPYMDGTPAPHRIVSCRPLLIAGVVQRCQASGHADLLRLWQRLDPHLAAMDRVEPGTYFGIPHDPHEDGSFAYLAGVEVADLADVPDGLSLIQLTAHRYAAFAHRGHASAIRGTLTAIRMCSLPALGYRPAATPYFERYDTDFDRPLDRGGCEIWMPLEQPNRVGRRGDAAGNAHWHHTTHPCG